MKQLFRAIVWIVHVVSFCGIGAVGVLGLIYEIVGHAKFEQILSAIGISNGFQRCWLFGLMMLFLLIVTYLIKIKWQYAMKEMR